VTLIADRFPLFHRQTPGIDNRVGPGGHISRVILNVRSSRTVAALAANCQLAEWGTLEAVEFCTNRFDMTNMARQAATRNPALEPVPLFRAVAG
jgi:hypothetical protein